MQYDASEAAWVGTSTSEKLSALASDRIDNFVISPQWIDINLDRCRVYRDIPNVTTRIQVYSPQGNSHRYPLTSEQAREKRISFEEASRATYRDCQLNERFGLSWSTHWFKIDVFIPVSEFKSAHDTKVTVGKRDWADQIHFIFDCECEGLVWLPRRQNTTTSSNSGASGPSTAEPDSGAQPLQSFAGVKGNDRRVEWVMLPEYATIVQVENHPNGTPASSPPPSSSTPSNPSNLLTAPTSITCYHFHFYVEIGCNGMFGVGNRDIIAPPDDARIFELKCAAPQRFNAAVWSLYWDIHVLAAFARACSKDALVPSGQQALRLANHLVNLSKYSTSTHIYTHIDRYTNIHLDIADIGAIVSTNLK